MQYNKQRAGARRSQQRTQCTQHPRMHICKHARILGPAAAQATHLAPANGNGKVRVGPFSRHTYQCVLRVHAKYEL